MGILLGIGHKARQGKDEMGRYLDEKHGFNVLHFADMLKKMAGNYDWYESNKNVSAANILKLHKEDLEEDIKFKIPQDLLHQTKDPSYTFLQFLGTLMRRKDHNYWVNECFKNIDPDRDTCICDMRYINEFLAVKKRNGYTIDIQRYGLVWDKISEHYSKQRIICPNRDSMHRSECEIDSIPHDFTIINDGKIEAFHQQINCVLEYIREMEKI